MLITSNSSYIQVQNVPLYLIGIAAASWSDYGEWDACSVSCGEGTQQRTRQCNYPSCYNGTDCVGSEFDTQTCAMGGKSYMFVYFQA